MIVPSHTVTLIQQGKVTCLILPASKTQTRHQPATAFRRPKGVPKPPKVLREAYVVGQSYAVQAGYKDRPPSPEKCRVRVVGKSLCLLDEIEGRKAVAAGFDSLEDLYAHWREKHGTGPLATVPVLVVWFELDREQRGRYLRAAGGDYTASVHLALGAESDRRSPPEPECVTEQEQRELTIEARRKFSKQKAQEEARQERRSRAAKLKEAEARAEKLGVDVSDLSARIDATVEEMRRREANGGEEAA